MALTFCECVTQYTKTENIFLKNSSLITFVHNVLKQKTLECDELKIQLVTPYITDYQGVKGICDE